MACVLLWVEKRVGKQDYKKSIGEFDKSSLRRQKTQEKIILPNAKGRHGVAKMGHLTMNLNL